MVKNIFILSISIIFSFIAVEFLLANYIFDNNTNKLNRSMFYQSGKNIENYKDIFKYSPKQNIRTLGVFSDKELNQIIKEYDYKISTNNYGLVMNNDLLKKEKAILFLGDSFTEGQGGEPWFYELENQTNYTKKKLINGGLLGTGPSQWYKLAEYIKEDYLIEYESIHIFIILEDLTRKIWQLNANEILCLQKEICNYRYGLQGIDFTDDKFIMDDRIFNSINNFKHNSYFAKQNLKNFFKNSSVIKFIYYKFYLPFFSKRIENKFK